MAELCTYETFIEFHNKFERALLAFKITTTTKTKTITYKNVAFGNNKHYSIHFITTATTTIN